MPGVQGGTAIAATVFGENNPGGKLIATMYHSSYINETDFLNMSMTNGVGRSYKYYTGTPLFPFGYVRTPTHAPVPRTADARHSDPWLRRGCPTPRSRCSASAQATATQPLCISAAP